jgi:hypothetical protein
MIKRQIVRLKKDPGKKPEAAEGHHGSEGSEAEASVAERLERMEKLIQEMSDRLKNIEERLPAKK